MAVDAAAAAAALREAQRAAEESAFLEANAERQHPYRVVGEDGELVMRYPLQAGILVNALSLEDLDGMVKHYDEPYSHATEASDFDSIPPQAQ